MSNILLLAPAQLWRNFYALTRIPRPSGHCNAIGNFLENFGKNLGLETLRDQAGNVLIRKPATAGMEKHIPVILQAHMDMVPQKNSDCNHNFETDPIEARIDGEWVKANQTTLGADNGIGLAAGMAILESVDIKHPDLELFVTVDEETGMHGAFGLQPGFLKGKILMNLDSEDEGELYVGCAGGLDAVATFRYHEVAVPEGDVALKISITGLKGGHSGVDIHLQRANANKLMFRFLKEIVAENEARLAGIDGGSLRNAIPREAFAVITVPEEGVEDIFSVVAKFETLFNAEFSETENKIILKAEKTILPSGLIPEEIQDDLINSVTASQDGVYRYIPEMPSVVETSGNLAIVKSDGNTIQCISLLRSSVDSFKTELASMFSSLFSLAGAKVTLSGSYPGWKPDLKSPVLQLMQKIHEEEFGYKPAIKIIHAGLECGILGINYPHIDMISFGPTIRFPHSPDEKVKIDTVAGFWKLLIVTLNNIPAL